MRSIGPSNKKKGPTAGQAAAASFQKFIWRTLVPMTPIFLIFYGLMFFNNRGDMSGDYQGSSPVTGVVDLTIKQEEGGVLSGYILLKQQYRMKIIKGTYSNDDVDLHFEIPGNDNLIPRFQGTHFAGPVSGINMFGNVEPGDFLEGDLFNGRSKIHLKLKRNTATALFKKYWFHF